MPGSYNDLNVIPEIPYYIGAIARVPYILPGTKELADAVIEAMRNHDLAILQNHGLVTVGKSARAAIQNAAFFELACDILLRGKDRVHTLPEDAVRALKNHEFSSS
jgi:ribulose-5-phosphate 4-epimerase/fuculose-1-phosphate aldolase